MSSATNKLLVIRAGIHTLHVLIRLANSEDPDQTASSEAVCAVGLGLFGRQPQLS